MNLAPSLEAYLDKAGIEYSLCVRPGAAHGMLEPTVYDVPLHALASSVVLKDSKGLLMGVFPSTHTPDLTVLQHVLGHEVSLATEDDLVGVFEDTEAGAIPPVGAAYGLRAIVDEALLTPDCVYFSAGNHDFFVCVSGEQFNALQVFAQRASFAVPVIERESAEFVVDDAPAFEMLNGLYLQVGGKNVGPVTDVMQRIETLDALPPLPEMGQRLFQLRFDPRADAEDLAKIIELDPSLAAQVVRYARSPLYAYRGKIESIRDAISRVLGFDMVMNMALGLAAAGFMSIAPNGPIGRRAVWRHAVYSAALTQALAKAMPRESAPKAGLAYLGGLLHNIGILLLGHLYPQEFYYVNSVVSLSHHVHLTDVEQSVLGTGHQQIGLRLMLAWNMPDELLVAVREHHNESYRGKHAVYANLVLLADRLLKRHDIGDAESGVLPEAVLTALQLPAATAEQIASLLLEQADDLDVMAEQLAA